MTAVSRRDRHTKARPCQVCGGWDQSQRGQGERCHGWTADGWSHCSREEHAGHLSISDKSGTFAHRLEGDCNCGTVHNPRPQLAKKKPASKAMARKIVATYDYQDANGILIHQTVRFEPKGFSQRRPDPEQPDKWLWNLDGVDPVLYRLPELLAAPTGELIFVAEGEKAVDRLRDEGLTATCSPMGAGKWRNIYAQWFKGRHVAILPDNDARGWKHAHQVAASLRPVAASVKIVELPGLGAKEDPYDWLTLGHTAEEIHELAEAAPEWEPPKPQTDGHGPYEELAGTVPLKSYHATDLGNAQRLVTLHGPIIRYCAPWKAWLIFNGKRWIRDSTCEIERLAKGTIQSIFREAFSLTADEDRDKRNALLSWGMKSEATAKDHRHDPIGPIRTGRPRSAGGL